jgi:hypothetical protein
MTEPIKLPPERVWIYSPKESKSPFEGTWWPYLQHDPDRRITEYVRADLSALAIEQATAEMQTEHRLEVELLLTEVVKAKAERDEARAELDRLELRLAVQINALDLLIVLDNYGDADLYNKDPQAATRRAITRAAAEIGRNME